MSETNTVSPLRQHMIEDMAARKLNPHTQRSHIQSCKRFAAWLKRSPDTATPDETVHHRTTRLGKGMAPAAGTGLDLSSPSVRRTKISKLASCLPATSVLGYQQTAAGVVPTSALTSKAEIGRSPAEMTQTEFFVAA